MARIQEMMGMGLSGGAAQAIAGSCTEAQAVAGSAQTDASFIAAANSLIVTGSSNQGAILPSDAQVGDSFMIFNGTGATLKIYPHVGGKVNNGTTNTEQLLVTLTGGIFTRVGPTHWICVTTI